MLVVVVSLLGIGVGIFCALCPERAAKRWGRRFVEIPAHLRSGYLQAYRIYGIVMAVAAALVLLKALMPNRVPY
jgi:hypothetical protein